ncbi:MAG: hypothetical protein OXC18_19295 [Desulfurellaceae bacterium]|nr:hypothetical protein [Desulfurellaceae bacterium]
MLSKTFPIVMDTGIVSILTIASFLLLAFTMETIGGIHAIPRIDITSISTAGFLFFGTVGFTIVGCRAPHPFWPHLMRVAVGYWFILLLFILLTTDVEIFVLWLITGPFLITPVVGLGGMASFVVIHLDQRST